MPKDANLGSVKGGATIKQQGHTDNGVFGSNVDAKVKGRGEPTNLRISAK